MDTPGIEVKPITMLSGEQIQCEIFFRDVKVPKENVVGRIGGGWTVAKYLLQFERGGNAAAPGLKARLRRVRDLARACGVQTDGDLTRKIARTAIDISALEFTEHRLMSGKGAPSGIHASMLKIRSTELSQRVTEVALEVAGLDA